MSSELLKNILKMATYIPIYAPETHISYICAPKSFGPKHTYSDLTHLLKYLQFDTEGSEQLVHILEISISNDFTTFEETKVH